MANLVLLVRDFFVCALAVSVLFSCSFVLAGSPGCQQLSGSFLSSSLSLLLVFSGAFFQFFVSSRCDSSTY